MPAMRLKLVAGMVAAVLGVASSIAVSSELSQEAVFGRHLDARDELQALPEFGDASARVLQRYQDGRIVAELALPAGWQWPVQVLPSGSFEILVLEGRLQWGDEELSRLDYLQWPAGTPSKSFSSLTPTKALVFIDPAKSSDPAAARVVKTTPTDWGGSTVSKRDTGVELKLEIRSLFKDEQTGRWTWLLRAGPDLVLPWEVHRTVEEVYLIEGEYQLHECLPAGKTRFDYRPGGYFHRPAGIVHGGPDSGSPGDILMLLRAPTELTVEFRSGCP